METINNVQLDDTLVVVAPELLNSVQKSKEAEEKVKMEIIAATGSSQVSMKRKMMTTLSSQQEVAAAAQPPKPKLGSGNGLGASNFPPDPPLPPSGGPDGTLEGWNGSSWDAYNASHTGYMNGLMDILFYINAHPSTSSLASLVKYISAMQQNGLFGTAAQNMLSMIGGGLLLDGLVHNADFAFLEGYQGQGPGMGSYEAYLNALKGYLSQFQGVPFLGDLYNQVNTLLSSQSLAVFQGEHVNAQGQLIWSFSADGTNTDTWVWTGADSSTQFMIEQLILNSSASSGGQSANPNMDIAALNAAITQMQTADLLGTLDSVWNQFHDAGLLIIAFMLTMDDGYLNSESGNADIMDKQHQYDQGYVQKIQQIAQSIEGWGTGGIDGHAGADQVDAFRNSIFQLIDLIDSNSQFANSLSPAITNFLETLHSTQVTFSWPPDGGSQTAMTDDLFHLLKGEDSSGNPLVPGGQFTIEQEIAGALKQGLAPNPPIIPAPAPTPAPSDNPDTTALQSFVSSITAISSAVSSSSTQLTTAVSQVEQEHQAILKLGTGVVDPHNGLNAVTMNSISHQVSN